MMEIAENIENGTRALVEESGFESGVGFPTGLSLNECAAHYTPNANDKICMCYPFEVCYSADGSLSSVLKNGDIMKVDFGVHVQGRICDSAFTLSWNPAYDNLLTAAKDATNTGVRVCPFVSSSRAFHSSNTLAE